MKSSFPKHESHRSNFLQHEMRDHPASLDVLSGHKDYPGRFMRMPSTCILARLEAMDYIVIHTLAFTQQSPVITPASLSAE
jgi:hypothetical protein